MTRINSQELIISRVATKGHVRFLQSWPSYDGTVCVLYVHFLNVYNIVMPLTVKTTSCHHLHDDLTPQDDAVLVCSCHFICLLPIWWQREGMCRTLWSLIHATGQIPPHPPASVTLKPVPVWHCLTVAQQYILPGTQTKDAHIVFVTHILCIFSLPWTHTHSVGSTHRETLTEAPPHTHTYILIPIAEGALCILWLIGQLLRRGRERLVGGGRWRQRERDRGIAKKKRQRQIEQEQIRFAEGQQRHIQFIVSGAKTEWAWQEREYRKRIGSRACPTQRKRVSC